MLPLILLIRIHEVNHPRLKGKFMLKAVLLLILLNSVNAAIYDEKELYDKKNIVLLFEFSSIENSPKDLYTRMVLRFKLRAFRRAA